MYTYSWRALCREAKKSHSVQTTKKIEQNLPQVLSTLTRGVQIPRAAYFKQKWLKKYYESDFMQLFGADFSADATILLNFFLPMKTWKNLPNFFFFSTGLAAQTAQKQKFRNTIKAP